MHDAVLDSDVQDMSPRLASELAHELLVDGPIIDALGWLPFRCRQGLEQIASCDDADKLAIADYGDAVDSMPVKDLHDLAKGRGPLDSDHIRSHYIASGAAVRLCIVSRCNALVRKEAEPP